MKFILNFLTRQNEKVNKKDYLNVETDDQGRTFAVGKIDGKPIEKTPVTVFTKEEIDLIINS